MRCTASGGCRRIPHAVGANAGGRAGARYGVQTGAPVCRAEYLEVCRTGYLDGRGVHEATASTLSRGTPGVAVRLNLEPPLLVFTL